MWQTCGGDIVKERWSSCESFSFILWWTCTTIKNIIYTHRYSVSLSHRLHLVLLRYCVWQNVPAGARGVVSVTVCTQYRWGGCGCWGLLGMLQLLPVDLPLLGTSVLKPDLHLPLGKAECHWQLWLPSHCDIAVELKLFLKLHPLVVSVHHPVLVLSASLPTWSCLFNGLLWSFPGNEGILSRDEVVRGERSPSSGGRSVAQIRVGEVDLRGVGAWPREAVWVLLPGRVKGVPGTCRQITDSRDVMVVAREIIRRRNVLTVQWQCLSRLSDRSRAGVHPGILARQVGWISGRPGKIKPPRAC